MPPRSCATASGRPAPPARSCAAAATAIDLQPRDVGGEARDRDAAAVVAEQLGQRLAHVRLRSPDSPCAQRVGRIADQRQHAFVAERAQARLVGDRRRPAARDRASSRRCAAPCPAGVRIASALGSGIEWVRRDQLDIERPDREAARQRHLGDRHLAQQVGVAQLAPQHRGGERRRVDRAAQLRPEIGHGAEMILVRVGQHQADEIVAMLLDEGGIGHDHVDARHRLVAEGHAEIDHQPLAGIAVEVEVHADLARAAERQEQQLVALASRCASAVGDRSSVPHVDVDEAASASGPDRRAR